MWTRLGAGLLVGVLSLAACTSGATDEAGLSAPASPAPGDASSTPAQSGREPAPQGDQGPPTAWVVTLGDSYVSGEGARYAANTSGDRDAIDALGSATYDDGPEGETDPGCHRAELWPGLVEQPRVDSVNFACSGATTRSATSGLGFKPGLDFARTRAGGVGQLVALERFARRHPVSDVVVSIGGNDAGFGQIVASCLLGFLDPQRSAPPCSEDEFLAARMQPAALEGVSDEVAGALQRVAVAMKRAGYRPAEYAITLATYPAPLPPADLLRYDEEQRRSRLGGCPLFDADADWAAQVVVPRINRAVSAGATASGLPNVGVLDLSRSLVGHRLCEEGVARLDELAAESWQAPGLARQVEWVNEVSFDFSRTQESLHPNYWGTQVLRSCVENAVAGDDARSARCVVAREGGSSQATPDVRLVG